jgi:hypothetical protein
MSIEQQLEQDDDHAPYWNPELEPMIIGTLVRREERQGKFDLYEVDTVRRDDDEERAIHRTSKVLREDLAPAKIGDRIGVRYLGRHEKGYKRFRVAIEAAGESETTVA